MIGSPRKRDITTSHVERLNLTLRMAVRRYTRSTNAFSKKLTHHTHGVALYALWYNFMREHSSLGYRTTPAMKAGLAEFPLDMRWLVTQLTAVRQAVRQPSVAPVNSG